MKIQIKVSSEESREKMRKLYLHNYIRSLWKQ
jgi:hypothetical protein